MNGPMNDDLITTLNKRADDFARLGGHDLDLTQVVSRAGEIRRGRRMRASMVMAAVLLAIAVPVGITVLGQNDPTQKPTPAPLTQVPADHSPIVLSDLDEGALPKLGVVDGRDWRGPDVMLPASYGDELAYKQLSRAYATKDGLMLVSVDDSGNSTVRYWSMTDPDQTKTWPIDGEVAVSPDGNVAAFAEPNGTIVTVQDDGSRYYALGTIPDDGAYSVISVSGENCSGRSDLQDDCSVLVGTLGANPRTWTIDAHGATAQTYAGFKQVADVSTDGKVGGIVSYTDSGACSAVQDERGTELWKTCTYRLTSFSPGGDYVLASNTENDGAGEKDLTILDARTGAVVLHLGTVDSAYVFRTEWEDASHVLAVVTDSMSASVQRIDLDGHRTNAFPITPNGRNGIRFELVQP